MRTELPIIVLGSTGAPVSGASVRVNLRGTSTLAAIYLDATNPGTLLNPLITDAMGRAQGWVERGAYDCVISSPTFATYTEPYDSTPASDGSIDTAWVADSAVTRAKMGALAIVNADISSGAAIAASKLASYPTDVTKVFKGDGSWAQIINADISSGAAIALSKLADPGAGKVVGSSSGTAAVFPPGYEWAYNDQQSGVSITATTEGTAQDVVSSGAFTYDGTPVIIEFYAPVCNPANDGVGRQITLILKDGSTVLGSFQTIVNNVAGVTIYEQSFLRRKMTPSAGSHTFKVAAFVSGSTGAVSGGPGGSGQYLPILIRVTKA